jgi:hypothetical protein
VKLRLVTPVFEQIHRHAAATWRPGGGADPASAGTGGGGSGSGSGGSAVAPPAAGTGSSDAEVPVVLLSVGASADHAHTCPDLAHYLRQRVRGARLAGILCSCCPCCTCLAPLRPFMRSSRRALLVNVPVWQCPLLAMSFLNLQSNSAAPQ